MINGTKGKSLILQNLDESLVMIKIEMAYKQIIDMYFLVVFEKIRVLPFGKICVHIRGRARIDQHFVLAYFQQHPIALANIEVKTFSPISSLKSSLCIQPSGPAVATL